MLSAQSNYKSQGAIQLKVLIVDDDRDVGECLDEFLSAEGYQVTVFHDPTIALANMQSSEFHLAVLDIMMPKLNGMDLLVQIRQFDPDIAVIILTGYPSLESASSSIEHDVSAYIRKPFAVGELRTAIQRIVRKKGLVLHREEEMHATIGRNIRTMRKSQGLTLKQMARRTGLSISLLSLIERAESQASIGSLFKVATALDIRLTEIFGDY